MFSIGLIIFGTCVVAGGIGVAAIACEDKNGAKKNDSSYRDGGFDPWLDDRYPF
jgi:hypothetical protein